MSYTWAVYDPGGKMRREGEEETADHAAASAAEAAALVSALENPELPARLRLPLWRYTVWGPRGSALSRHSGRSCPPPGGRRGARSRPRPRS